MDTVVELSAFRAISALADLRPSLRDSVLRQIGSNVIMRIEWKTKR